LAYASEIVFPASQIPEGSASLSIVYDHSDQKLNIQTSSRDQVTVGGFSYFSQVSNNFECQGKQSDVTVKLLCNPHSGLYYWLKAGSGSYELEIPSATVKSIYSTLDNGYTAGAGVRKILFPDTLFTPAIAVDLGITYDSFELNALQQGSQQHKVSTKLELTEVQAALTVSKILHKFEPYGGIKVFRTYTRLTDRDSLDSVNGLKDNAGIFLGARLKFLPKEALIIEGSLVGETSITAGWNIQF
jgi:hypothetical protein